MKFTKNEEVFYKIGITKQTVNKRFRGSRIPYKHEVIKYLEGEAGYVFDLETKLQQELKEYKYVPKETFGGNTECFIYCDEVKEEFLKLF